MTTLLRRLTTPVRVARLGLRRGDSGGGCDVLAVLAAFGVLGAFGAFEDLEGRIGSTKFMLLVLLTVSSMAWISCCYAKKEETARHRTNVAR